MDKVSVHVLPALTDNYMYIITHGSYAVVIDPSEGNAVREFLSERGLQLSHVLITHYDHDHVGGVDSLRQFFKPKIAGPEPCPFSLDVICQPGSIVSCGNLEFEVIDTPGHAFPHVAFHEKSQGWLFSGDCLFGAGCGRVRGEAFDVMYRSILSLEELPGHTLVYFGHEYTLSNLAFAQAVEPDNPAIAERRKKIAAALNSREFSSPSTLTEERATNPFMRADSLEIRRRLGMSDAPAAEVFRALRQRKDVFSG